MSDASAWPTLLGAMFPDRPELPSQVEKLLVDHEPAAVDSVWSERDAWLITYADQFQANGQVPLASLNDFYESHFAPWINGIHILPFYPWSSDDGYSIIDYTKVDPRYGTWRQKSGDRFWLVSLFKI